VSFPCSRFLVSTVTGAAVFWATRPRRIASPIMVLRLASTLRASGRERVSSSLSPNWTTGVDSRASLTAPISGRMFRATWLRYCRKVERSSFSSSPRLSHSSATLATGTDVLSGVWMPRTISALSEHEESLRILPGTEAFVVPVAVLVLVGGHPADPFALVRASPSALVIRKPLSRSSLDDG
jgi:hypothetical protein